MNKLLQKIFSVKNDRYHKIISILFLKIKIKSKKRTLLSELERYRQQNFLMSYEINSLLKNYKNFIPKSEKIKVYLLNDTSREINHLGCNLVQENIKKLCSKHRAEIYFSDSSIYLYNENYRDIMKHSDLVIFNGEGTLHDSACIDLLKKCKLAYNLGKKIVLINTVWQNNSSNYEEFLNYIDFISCRESESYDSLPQFAKEKARIVPDLTFYGNIQENKVKNDAIIFTDSVLPEFTNELQYYAKKYNKKFYYMDNQHDGELLSETVLQNMSKNSRIITGRFHALALGIKYGIPTFAVSSNTHKIKGLLEDAKLSEYYTDNFKNFDSKIKKFVQSSHEQFIQKSKEYSKEANIKIENLFDDIFQLNIWEKK